MRGGGAVLLTSPILWHCACFKMMIFFLSCRMHENAFSHLGFFFLFFFVFERFLGGGGNLLWQAVEDWGCTMYVTALSSAPYEDRLKL